LIVETVSEILVQVECIFIASLEMVQHESLEEMVMEGRHIILATLTQYCNIEFLAPCLGASLTRGYYEFSII
jgi:hypothetical protein